MGRDGRCWLSQPSTWRSTWRSTLYHQCLTADNTPHGNACLLTKSALLTPKMSARSLSKTRGAKSLK